MQVGQPPAARSSASPSKPREVVIKLNPLEEEMRFKPLEVSEVKVLGFRLIGDDDEDEDESLWVERAVPVCP